MEDTIKIMLDKTMFMVTDLSLFQKARQEASRGYFTLVQNPSKSEQRSGIYKPRLTLTRRFNASGRNESTLAIELSLAKLLFKNNFDEFRDESFKQSAEILQSALKDMGIRVFYEVLINAPVSAIHLSKNFPLTDGLIPYHYIKRISEGNYKLSLATDKIEYRDDGNLFKIHTNSWELVFYDKLNEMGIAKRSEKLSEEKDISIQLKLFENLKIRKPFEVLRMEARLNTRANIRHILKEIGRNDEVTFKGLYNSEFSQAVLLYFLDYIEKARPSLLDYQPRNTQSILPDIILNNPAYSSRKQLFLYGMRRAMEDYSMRELRNMLGKDKTRAWYRLVNECSSINLPKSRDVFEVLRKQLTAFKPLRLLDFQDKMINNDK